LAEVIINVKPEDLTGEWKFHEDFIGKLAFPETP